MWLLVLISIDLSENVVSLRAHHSRSHLVCFCAKCVGPENILSHLDDSALHQTPTPNPHLHLHLTLKLKLTHTHTHTVIVKI